MPTLDVTGVLSNPAFVDTALVCLRSVQSVGQNGIAVNTQNTVPFSGVVTQKRGSLLRRGDAGSRLEGDIEISTTFVLIDGRTGLDADIVTWNGRQYTVTNVQDWTTFGAGFVTAICDLRPLSGG